jgi:hypothetical protein
MYTDVKKASVQPSQVIRKVLRQICVPLVQESGRLNREAPTFTKGKFDHSLAEQAIGRHAKRIPRPNQSDPRTIAVLDQMVFAFANAELQLPEHAGPTKQIVNATLLGLWSEDNLAAVQGSVTCVSAIG